MNNIIYNVSIKMSEFDENNVYTTEHPIIEEKEDIYIVLDVEEYNYNLDNCHDEDREYVAKEDYYFEIYKKFDEDELSLDTAIYPRVSIDNISASVYSLKKEQALMIAKKYISNEVELAIKKLEKYKNTISKIN